MKNTIPVIEFGNENLLHLIKDRKETECGKEYTWEDIQLHFRDNAAVWCANCLDMDNDNE